MKRWMPFVIPSITIGPVTAAYTAAGAPLWVGLVSGLVGAGLAFIAVTDRNERSIMWYECRAETAEALKSIQWIVVLKSLLGITLAAGAFGMAASIHVPDDQAALVGEVVRVLGVSFAFYAVIVIMMALTTSSHEARRVEGAIESVVHTALFGSIVLFFAIASLTTLLDLLEKDPRTLVTVTVLGVVSLALLAHAFKGRGEAYRWVAMGGVRTVVARGRPAGGSVYPVSIAELMVYDDERIAVHEAGHAMTHAVLGSLHPSLKARIEEDSSGGSVSSVVHLQLFMMKEGVLWSMCSLMAGLAAERIVYGESPMGSTSDWRKWMVLARQHLANQHEAPFFEEPASEWERHANVAAIAQLRESQIGLCRRFLEANREVLDEVVAALVRERVLDVEDLLPMLKRVELVDGFPRPFPEAVSPERLVISERMPKG